MTDLMKFGFFCTEKKSLKMRLFLIITVFQTSSMHVSAFVLVTIISVGFLELVGIKLWRKLLKKTIPHNSSVFVNVLDGKITTEPVMGFGPAGVSAAIAVCVH